MTVETESTPRTAPGRPRLAAAGAGVAAVLLGFGAAELVAGLVAPSASPVLVVAAAAVDLSPSWAKELAIALFGTADKIALVVGIGLVMLLAAAGAGVLEARRPPWGRVIIGVAGVLGIGAAMTRADAALTSLIPPVVAVVVGVLALGFLLRRRPERSAPADDPSRRAFLGWTGGAAVLGALAAVGGYALQAGARAATAAREALHLPAPAVPAAPVPAGSDLAIDGLAPVVTPNDDFYRIDIAFQIPRIDPIDWRLRIHGMVDQVVEIGWEELTALPLQESSVTLCCVSNQVGGDLISNAVWTGYPIRELLARAAPHADADMVLSKSPDGFSASTPLSVLQDSRDALLAIGMNGELLPLEHGFPARLVVPGLYGYVSATKWVTELEVTRFDRADAYWTVRGWSPRGPVKLQSRIDVPFNGERLPAGEVVIAGVAWQQHVGVAAVEVQIDEGEWMPADLATPISDDTWVQWSVRWDAVVGQHTVRVRATSKDGEVQTAERADVIPDGATGHDQIGIRIE